MTLLSDQGKLSAPICILGMLPATTEPTSDSSFPEVFLIGHLSVSDLVAFIGNRELQA